MLALRHQVGVLQRQIGKPAKLNRWDRLLFALSYRAYPDISQLMLIVKPDTLVRWHRTGYRLFWRLKSRRTGGRPKVPTCVCNLIREMSQVNPGWGAPRIHGELLKLGMEISQSSVARYMIKRKGPPSQSWRTFLRNHMDGIASLDMFVVPTLGFRLLYGLVILNHNRRQIIHVSATYHPTAQWLVRQISEPFLIANVPNT